MNSERTAVPLLSALDTFNQKDYAYFAIPGHRYERGMPPALVNRIGGEVYRYDLTETVGLDDLHDAKGAIKEAQEAAAALFGADECRFSVNGTTALLEAMILATAGPGEEILIARDAHRSAVSGLILSGAKPVWLMPKEDEKWKVSAGIEPDTVRQALEEHPGVKAVLIVSPTYYGQASDVAAIADLCHERGIPLIVDAAHGTHFSFSNAFPLDSILAGADLTAMSLHKTAGSMTQSSMLFWKDTTKAEEEEENSSNQKPLVDMGRVDAALRMTISSSPSYVLMASLDAARAQLEEQGEEDAEEAVKKAQDLRRALLEIPGVQVRGGSSLWDALRENTDITRVVFSIPGRSGTWIRDRLAEDGNIAVEMADARNVVAVVTAANTDREILQLSMAVFKLTGLTPDQDNQRPADFPGATAIPEMAVFPRDAFFAGKEEIPLLAAAGRICADILCPYPPGIPVLVPGERIDEEQVQYLIRLINQGIPVQGVQEKNIIRVLSE